MKLSIP